MSDLKEGPPLTPEPVTEAAASSAELAVAPELVANSLGEYLRAWAARIRAGDSGILPVIVGASGEEPLAAEIRARCPDAVDLVGRTELTDLIDLTDAAVFTVGNDTGATHIAAAGGHPVVVLFSDASDPRRCAPRGHEIRVLTSPHLDRLPVSQVFSEVMQATRSLMCSSGKANTDSNIWV